MSFFLLEFVITRTLLGATDVEEEGKWKWVDGSAFEFTYWAEGQPSGGTEKNCLEMDPTDSGQGRWSDTICDGDFSEGFQFVCTYDAGKQHLRKDTSP